MPNLSFGIDDPSPQLLLETTMNRYLLATLAATLLIGGASAREVAYCDAGFDIAILTGDKAVCQKKPRNGNFIPTAFARLA